MKIIRRIIRTLSILAGLFAVAGAFAPLFDTHHSNTPTPEDLRVDKPMLGFGLLIVLVAIRPCRSSIARRLATGMALVVLVLLSIKAVDTLRDWIHGHVGWHAVLVVAVMVSWAVGFVWLTLQRPTLSTPADRTPGA